MPQFYTPKLFTQEREGGGGERGPCWTGAHRDACMHARTPPTHHREEIKASFFKKCDTMEQYVQALDLLWTPPSAPVFSDLRHFQSGVPAFCDENGKFPCQGLMEVCTSVARRFGCMVKDRDAEDYGKPRITIEWGAFIMGFWASVDVINMPQKSNELQMFALKGTFAENVMPNAAKALNWMASEELCPTDNSVIAEYQRRTDYVQPSAPAANEVPKKSRRKKRASLETAEKSDDDAMVDE